ncbi:MULTISPECIES: FKBP-type peptidyl-prolyl cis-trans isomerase [unclassified Xenorhabdus]|uniref:FKBP-type peptidyl-prolyl cis-trans isomerase n=1 Tax=unclassified Xenorhabdus TaxID=2632833 RepID=UPI000C05684F|nr:MULTISPECIES: FKBP-type peptidyl-prolyl cis-trans isomerase [unclassified Xenorhabdus]MCC8381339.1 FKBP-type peptidyl-prolyl cis-trans isomerase [Xenorhabdus sp. PB30.3]PHM59223.1 FKBP-type peptidyl-prolyl cis-trans isomerase [Xenorhabdus sp. KK7.4]
MKSFLKTTLLATTLAMTFGVPYVMANEAKASDEVKLNKAFKTAEQQNSYALGASIGRYMEKSLEEQKALGIDLDKSQVMSGFGDAINNKSKLNDSEIQQILSEFDAKIRASLQVKMEKEASENSEKGNKFREQFAKEAGVVKTKSGLLYKVEREGTGKTPVSTDTVIVNYKGSLIDGKVFDSSYDRKEPLSIPLDGVIPGWTEGLQHLKKGGKMKLVIPPELAYGKNGVQGIPVNSTLVFEIELLDIKPSAKTK